MRPIGRIVAMGKNYVYSYRIVTFGKYAPCFDNDFFTLAICKSTMRRVIGKRLTIDPHFDKGKDSIWVVGIVGSTMAHNPEYKDYNEAGQILYVAKINEVIDYGDYFSSDEYSGRKDRIYRPSTSDKAKYEWRGRHFEHCGKDIHEEEELQDLDWDMKHKDAGKFVLASNEFFIVDKEKDNSIKQADKNANWCNGRGHRVFEANDKLVGLFEGWCRKEDHFMDSLHMPDDSSNCGGCGKKKPRKCGNTCD